MREINKIYIHQSGFPYGTLEATRDYHLSKGWDDIGYHFVIENGYSNSIDFSKEYRLDEMDGVIKVGRKVENMGAHVYADNATSIGIMLIGDSWGSMTKKQLDSLIDLCKTLMAKYDIKADNVLGHFETTNIPTEKTCPFSKEEEEYSKEAMDIFRKLIGNNYG